MAKRLINGKLTKGIFVIRFAEEPDQLEIIKSEFYLQKSIREEAKLIVGFAKSYDEALQYVIDVTDEAIKEYGEPLIKEYLSK